MPNHVINILTITGDKKKVQAVLTQIQSKKKEDGTFAAIDFNEVVPMPEDLSIESGSSAQTAKAIIADMLKNPEFSIKEYALENLEKLTRSASVLPYLKNYFKYGSTDWYDWCYKHWGTKWNAYSVEITGKSQIQFQTAWSTPLPVIQKLSEQHKDVTIRVEFADEDLGANCGWYELKGGEMVDITSLSGDEAIQHACTLWGYDYDEVLLEREEA